MAQSKLKYRLPDLVDTRDGTHLMVWGDLGVWLVMDDELKSLVERFDGVLDTAEVIARHAVAWRQNPEEVLRIALPLISHFEERGVLARRESFARSNEEPLSIANVTFNITNRCNLHCPFCYNAKRDGDEAAIDTVLNFLRSGQKVFTPDASLIILGGEPLLDPERLLDLVDRGGELFSRPPMISTNGTRLDGAMVSRLAKSRLEIQVSLDSADEATHDRARGKGVYARAVQGIRLLVEAGVYTIVSMVITRDTVEQMGEFLALADKLKVDEARFIPLRKVGAAAKSSVKTDDLPDPLAGFEQITAILDEHPGYGRLLARDFFTIAAEQCRFSSSRVSCGIGRRVIFIDADGSLFPCPNHATEPFLLGHIETDSLETVLKEPGRMGRIRKLYHVDNYRQCAKCPFRRWCAGDCRGEVLATFKKPTAPSPHCKSLRKMYKQILWRLALGDSRLGGLLQQSPRHSAKNTFL